MEAAKAWKSGDTAIAWPEDVESVEFTLYKTVNSQTTVVDADDLKNYWVDTREGDGGSGQRGGAARAASGNDLGGPELPISPRLPHL